MTDDLTEFTRHLFKRDTEPVPVPDPKPSNHVPNEGDNPTEKATDLQTFAAALFDRALGD